MCGVLCDLFAAPHSKYHVLGSQNLLVREGMLGWGGVLGSQGYGRGSHVKGVTNFEFVEPERKGMSMHVIMWRSMVLILVKFAALNSGARWDRIVLASFTQSWNLKLSK